LAIVAFLIGAVSALPWHVAPVGSVGLTAAMVLLVPLIALLAALGLGLGVAARVRRTTLSRLSRLAAAVRRVADGEADRVEDPLGSATSAELAEAINRALKVASVLGNVGEGAIAVDRTYPVVERFGELPVGKIVLVQSVKLQSSLKAGAAQLISNSFRARVRWDVAGVV
jgi:methyl-accepting chemotaxis protein